MGMGLWPGTLETQLGAGAAALSGCRRQLKDAAAKESRCMYHPTPPSGHFCL